MTNRTSRTALFLFRFPRLRAWLHKVSAPWRPVGVHKDSPGEPDYDAIFEHQDEQARANMRASLARLSVSCPHYSDGRHRWVGPSSGASHCDGCGIAP